VTGELAPARAQADVATAIFAGGCLWCPQAAFDAVPGVVKTRVGYAGTGAGQAEAIEVVYDAAQVSYDRLLDVFWHNIDPTAKDAQFCEHGLEHRTAIFYRGEDERLAVEASKARIVASGTIKGPIFTEIAPEGGFRPAEDIQQQFYKKSPAEYKFYRLNCGCDARLEEIWGAAALR
jgi:peptide-methionine (S)-S-oxide reductase